MIVVNLDLEIAYYKTLFRSHRSSRVVATPLVYGPRNVIEVHIVQVKESFFAEYSIPDSIFIWKMLSINSNGAVDGSRGGGGLRDQRRDNASYGTFARKIKLFIMCVSNQNAVDPCWDPEVQ